MSKQIIATVKFNTDTKELEAAEKQLSKIEDSLKEINDPNAAGQLEKAFKQLNMVTDESLLSFSEMGKAVEQYQTIALKAGITSPIGKEAIERAGNLKDKMDEVTTSVDILSKKGQGLQTALQLGAGLTAGYGAFLGVTTLLGKESENLQKAFVKLQAVQTVLASLDQIRLALGKERV